MRITNTAIGSGYYRVYKNGTLVSNHTAEREALEVACNLELQDPSAEVYYDHDYKVRVEIEQDEPTTPIDLRFIEPIGNIPIIANANSLTLQVAKAGNVAYVHWPEGTNRPPGHVTFMLEGYPQYIAFTLADGSYVVFTGPCKLVSGGEKLLQATEDNATIKVWFVDDLSIATDEAALDFAAKYPFKLNWTDRKPIGKSFPYRASGKPNNWLWSTEGQTQEEFEAGYHAHIDRCIENCQAVNAQGLIVWALEGEPFGHPISYIADPENHAKYCPEITRPLVKALFAKIVDAGLKPGVTIRPTRMVPVEWNQFGWWQETIADDAEYYDELHRKIKWAHDELGCRLFYLDSMIRGSDPQSPVPSGTSAMIPFELWETLVNEFPDSLMIPEQTTPSWLSVCCQFGGGLGPMDPVIAKAYPDAFQFMHGQRASYPRDTELLRAGIAAGNIGTFNAWYASPDLAALKSIQATP